MQTSDNKDLGDKKINNQQRGNTEQEINEGFSGQNIPEDYNPSEKELKSETETDRFGNENDVERARYTDSDSSEFAAIQDRNVDNSAIENKKSLENRDHNYDTDATRYKESHDKNQENRGNIQMDQE